jgi:hypothetical protein
MPPWKNLYAFYEPSGWREYLPSAITEKGRLWGTKLAFFRRKEIRVYTLT